MRKLLALLAATVLAATGVQRAQADVSVDFFYTALETEGSWLETSDYGYVWQPRDIAEDWRPYTVGNWAYTDAGWTWVSEEPHGWATHHYGRWILVESDGWVWVPDTEWAPAWVSWRRSTTHVGWAPLPPEARFERTVGIQEWSDSYYDVGPTNYSFVEVRNMGAPRLATVILPPQQNITIINETRNITKIVVRNNIIINEGPQYDVVVRESAQPIRRLRLERQTDIAFDNREVRRDVLRTQVEGDVLRMPAPQVRIASVDARPAKVERRLDKVTVNRGWKGRGGEQAPEMKELRAKFAKEAPQPPAGLPPQPKFERMADRAKRGEGQADATATTPGAEKPAGEQPTVGTEAEMRRKDRGARKPGTAETDAPVTAPADATKPGTTAEDARPGAGRRDRAKPGAAQPDATAPAATAPAAETTTPDATAPDATGKTPAAGRPGREMREDAAKRAREATTEVAPPDAADRAKKGRNAAERAKTDAVTEEEKVPAAAKERREAAEKAKTDAKMRKEAPEGATKPEAGKLKETSPAATTEVPAVSAQKRPGNKPDRSPAAGKPDASTERPNREDRPDSPATERPDRPAAAADRPARPDQPKRQESSPATERPDRPDRPNRPESSAATERPDRPDRPAGGPGAGGGGAEAAKPAGGPEGAARAGGGAGGGGQGGGKKAAKKDGKPEPEEQ